MSPFLQWTREQRRFWRRSLRISWALYVFNVAALLLNAGVIGQRLGREEYWLAAIQIGAFLVSLWGVKMSYVSRKRAWLHLRSLIQFVKDARVKIRFYRRLARMNVGSTTLMVVSRTSKLD